MHPLDSLNQEIIQCRQCPRLVEWREEVSRVKRKAYQEQDYWGKPVPGFGDQRARVLAVGLAPGAHGSNRTGRQFTGDASGNFLFPALRRAGFANQAEARSRSDGMSLKDLYLTAAARCAPPANKPTLAELTACQPYLEREIQILRPKVVLCLGKIAFERVLKIFSLRGLKFSHGAQYNIQLETFHLESLTLLCSYHPSQQNTLTGKLTLEMFDEIWRRAKELASRE